MKAQILFAIFLALSVKAFGATSSLDGATVEYTPESVSTNNDDYSVFDDVRIHAGASLINSFQDLAIAHGVRERGGLRGFEINLGIDLFSKHWIAEGVLVSYPQAQVNDTRLSSNGFELRLLYDSSIADSLTFHLGPGIASRTYNLKTSARPDMSVLASDQSFSSGASVLVGGIDYWATQDISAGIELSNHIPLANGDDPSSIDLAVKINGHF